MAVEFADDLAAFVDDDDFGASGTYTSAGGPITLAGIFDNEWLEKDVGAGAPVASRVPMLLVPEADLPSDAAQGDTWADGTHTYIVTEIEPDGTGMAVLMFNLQG